MSVRIIIDSSADLVPEVEQRVRVVPLTLNFGEEEFIDGVTIDHQQFYEKLIECDTLPRTSQAPPDTFAQVFEEETANGNEAVVITISSKLSGTYQSAMIAAEDFDNVFVVDSETTTIGAGILVEVALQMADAGMSAADIAEKLREERKNICVVALLDTLEYLKKGGRISKTVAMAGSLLSIKPVAGIRHGEIVMLGKARGSKQGNNLLAAEIEKAGGVDFDKPLLLGYTGLSDLLLQKYIEDSRHLWENETSSLRTLTIGSIIGTHTGPGTIAVAFYKKG